MSLAFIDGAEHQIPSPPLADPAAIPFATYVSNGRYGGTTYSMGATGFSRFARWPIPSAQQDPEVWFGLAYYGPMVNGGRPLMALMGDGSTIQHLGLYLNSNGSLSLYRGTSADILLGSSAASVMVASTWHYVEMHAIVDDTTGEYEVRVDGLNVLSATGVDTRNGGTTANVEMVAAYRITDSTINYYDDIYCVTGDGTGATGFQGEITIEGIVPNGNGNYSQLVGQDGDSTNNYLNVDEIPFSSTDYNGSTTPGDKDTYTYSNLTATTGNIIGSVIHFAAFKTAAGFIKGRRLIRISATDYAGADTPSLSATTRYFSEVLEDSPATSTAWTISEVNGLEAGFEVRSA